MSRLFQRYRTYLARKAEEQPGGGLVERQWQTAPWFLPLLIAILVCYWFGLTGEDSLMVVMPLGAISLFGIIFVGWVFDESTRN